MIAQGYQDAIELLREAARRVTPYSVESSVLHHARWALERALGEWLCGHVVRVDV